MEHSQRKYILNEALKEARFMYMKGWRQGKETFFAEEITNRKIVDVEKH